MPFVAAMLFALFVGAISWWGHGFESAVDLVPARQPVLDAPAPRMQVAALLPAKAGLRHETSSIRPAPALPVLAGWSEQEIDCLARNVYWEAAWESFEGRVLVAHITMNRVDDARFPDTICGVVLEPSQFSWTLRSNAHPSFRGPDARPPENQAWRESLTIARRVAERDWWWAWMEAHDRDIAAMTARRLEQLVPEAGPGTTTGTLARVRQVAMRDDAAPAVSRTPPPYGHRGEFEATPSLDEWLLDRRTVSGIFWYLNPDQAPAATVELWHERMLYVGREGAHLFFADPRIRSFDS